MKDQELLQKYIDFIPFLAQVCGSGCEIVIHDIRNRENSIVAIENNISKRKIGDPLTDLACELADNNTYKHSDFLVNYSGTSKGRSFISSTYFIKNNDRLIGLLCINKDITAINQMSESLHNILESFNLTPPQKGSYSENLDNPVSHMMYTKIAETISQSGVLPERMNMEEKIRIVQQLNASGILTMKGAVAELAEQLHISVPTVYRYISKSLSDK